MSGFGEGQSVYQQLRFRRQFLLAKAPITPLPYWQCLQMGEYYLYAHPDIEVQLLMDARKSMVLIGSIFDPAVPEKGSADILKDVGADVSNVEGLFTRIKRYVGRYALLYKDQKNAVILHDALGLREIYYCTKDHGVVCGSQPNLLVEFANPEIGRTRDPDLLEFYTRHLKDSRWNPNGKWIGDETYYEGVRHLLPNHYLDIHSREARRYWPNEPIKRLSLEDAVSKSCSFLQGTMRAMVHRHSIMMAVTAGKDSRTLLAASRSVKDQIYYFINNHRHMDRNHPDLSVPTKIFESIGVPFHVHEVPTDVDDEFRRIFLSNTFFASERILPAIYNVYFKDHSDKVNILGIGEIGRTRYGKEPKSLNSYRMAYKLGYKEDRYAIRQGEQILTELLPVARQYDLNALTLLYWEHTMGNWGTTGNSESDIAIEEFDPYDSHLLYEIFLGVDDKYTKYDEPILVREMIRAMWPDLLKWPFTPPGRSQDKIIKRLKRIGVYELLKELKYRAYYARYRHLRGGR
jgi:hypothetical protein